MKPAPICTQALSSCSAPELGASQAAEINQYRAILDVMRIVRGELAADLAKARAEAETLRKLLAERAPAARLSRRRATP